MSTPSHIDDIFGLPSNARDASLVLFGVPFDATASYHRRAQDGPAAILEESVQVDLQHAFVGELTAGKVHMPRVDQALYEKNATAREAVDAVREGDTTKTAAVNDAGDFVNQWVAQHVDEALKANKRVGIIGGDHSTPFAAIQAHATHYDQLGVLHIDAHADLREAYEGFTWSHASIMYNVLHKTDVTRIVQVGIRDYSREEQEVIEQSRGRVRTFFDHGLANDAHAGIPFEQTLEAIVNQLPQNVYVSFDIDGLDPTLCPGTGTPVPGGLNYRESAALLRAVARAGKSIVGFDLCEVAPHPANPSWDANVGARILFELCSWTLHSA